MPTYEYRCENGHTVEAVQSFSDEPLTICPECGGRLRRVFHPVGIVLKGSGFYATDNRSSKRHAAATKKDEKADTTAAKSDGGSAASGADKASGSGSGSGSGGSGGSSEKAS